MFTKEIQATCKRCGKKAPADSFVVDKDYKMAVCPECVKEKTKKPQPTEEATIEEVEKKPAGWDKEDDYLERASVLRAKERPKVQKIGSDTVKYSCLKCKYSFVYNFIKESPLYCPYCGTRVTYKHSTF